MVPAVGRASSARRSPCVPSSWPGCRACYRPKRTRAATFAWAAPDAGRGRRPGRRARIDRQAILHRRPAALSSWSSTRGDPPAAARRRGRSCAAAARPPGRRCAELPGVQLHVVPRRRPDLSGARRAVHRSPSCPTGRGWRTWTARPRRRSSIRRPNLLRWSDGGNASEARPYLGHQSLDLIREAAAHGHDRRAVAQEHRRAATTAATASRSPTTCPASSSSGTRRTATAGRSPSRRPRGAASSTWRSASADPNQPAGPSTPNTSQPVGPRHTPGVWFVAEAGRRGRAAVRIVLALVPRSSAMDPAVKRARRLRLGSTVGPGACVEVRETHSSLSWQQASAIATTENRSPLRR